MSCSKAAVGEGSVGQSGQWSNDHLFDCCLLFFWLFLIVFWIVFDCFWLFDWSMISLASIKRWSLRRGPHLSEVPSSPRVDPPRQRCNVRYCKVKENANAKWCNMRSNMRGHMRGHMAIDLRKRTSRRSQDQMPRKRHQHSIPPVKKHWTSDPVLVRARSAWTLRPGATSTRLPLLVVCGLGFLIRDDLRYDSYPGVLEVGNKEKPFGFILLILFFDMF